MIYPCSRCGRKIEDPEDNPPVCFACKRADTTRPHNKYSPGILADWQIKELSLSKDSPMIHPFVAVPVREVALGRGDDGRVLSKVVSRKVISYGLGHYGYDMRVANKFKVFHARQRYGIDDLNRPRIESPVVDPKSVDLDCFEEVEGDCIIPPNSFALSRSVERFNIPRGVLALVIGKSTYARCGLVVNVTPLEPEWRGHVTMEISNTTPLPARVYANEGIAQVMFFWASAECKTSYETKKGKYQDQPAEIVTPRM